jgi:hypothetical protein
MKGRFVEYSDDNNEEAGFNNAVLLEYFPRYRKWSIYSEIGNEILTTPGTFRKHLNHDFFFVSKKKKKKQKKKLIFHLMPKIHQFMLSVVG